MRPKIVLNLKMAKQTADGNSLKMARRFGHSNEMAVFSDLYPCILSQQQRWCQGHVNSLRTSKNDTLQMEQSEYSLQVMNAKNRITTLHS